MQILSTNIHDSYSSYMDDSRSMKRLDMNISPYITINNIIIKFFFNSDKQTVLQSCSNLNTDGFVLYL